MEMGLCTCLPRTFQYMISMIKRGALIIAEAVPWSSDALHLEPPDPLRPLQGSCIRPHDALPLRKGVSRQFIPQARLDLS